MLDNLNPERRLGPGEAADWLAVLRRMGLLETCVPELDETGRRRILRELPNVFCKSLDEDLVAELLRNEATRNPLFLVAALEELRVVGSFEKLPQRIHQLPRLRPAGQGEGMVVADIEQALVAMFGQILDRLDREASREAPRLVPAVAEAELQPHRSKYWLNTTEKDPHLFAQQVQVVCQCYLEARISIRRSPPIRRQAGCWWSTT